MIGGRLVRRLRGPLSKAKRRVAPTIPQPLVTPSSTPRSMDQVCVIAGLHRSGTTLVERLLAAACDVTVLRADVPESEGQHLQDVVPAARFHGGPGRFAFAPEMYTTPLDPAAGRAARDRLMACWTPWMEGEAPVLLEKSPPNLVRLPWFRSVFPGVRFLIVARDPRVTALATQKWSGNSVEELVYHWHVAYTAALRDKAEDCLVLRYEDLCARPAETLDAAIDHLGLTRRSRAGALEDRFQDIENRNATYLARLPPRTWGDGIWRSLGYEM